MEEWTRRHHGTWMRRTGEAPKTGLPFRLPEAITKCRVAIAPTGHAPGGKSEAVEVLCDGQQFIAYGVHPDTGQSYHWHDLGPLDAFLGVHEMLPEISEPELRDFLSWVADTYGPAKPASSLTERATAAIKPKAKQPLPEGQESPVDAFNAAHDITDLLNVYGYRHSHRDHWISPNSTTGSAAVQVICQRWRSLSGSDAGAEIGAASATGDTRTGDAFDLYAHYEHGGDHSAAVKAYAREAGLNRHVGASVSLDDFQMSGPGVKEVKAALPLQASAEFVAARTPAEYLIDGTLRRGWLYTLTAPTGHGKSAVALAIAFGVACGGYIGSREVTKGHVLFLAGENADDIRERWIATCEVNGVNPDDLPVTFLPGVWDLKGAMQILREHFRDTPLALVVCDTLAAYFDGEDENSNSQQQVFATEVLRPLTELPGRPTALVPAHPTKGAGKDALTPKGGSSLLNAVDGNLAAWNSDGTIRVHWQGKFRGAPWTPMFFALGEHLSDNLQDAVGRVMPTVVARALLDSEIGKSVETTVKIENQVLKLLSDGLTVREIAADVYADGQRGVSKSRVDRVIQRLHEQKWIAKNGRKWALTTQGVAVLQQASEEADLDA